MWSVSTLFVSRVRTHNSTIRRQTMRLPKLLVSLRSTADLRSCHDEACPVNTAIGFTTYSYQWRINNDLIGPVYKCLSRIVLHLDFCGAFIRPTDVWTDRLCPATRQLIVDIAARRTDSCSLQRHGHMSKTYLYNTSASNVFNISTCSSCCIARV